MSPEPSRLERPASQNAVRLYAILGQERDQTEVARLLRAYVRDQRPDVVGAHQVTCSDEAERECIDAFHRNLVRFQLPSLKYFSKAAFQSANLGGRYEWGSIAIAENHYEQARTRGWKLLLVKLNAHVSVEPGPDGHPAYGRMERYGSESVYCGAIEATLGGHSAPFTGDLAEAFQSEGIDRLGVLRDPSRIDPHHRNLVAAAVSARLQARRAMIDVQDHVAEGPTLYVIVPSVSINREGRDTEIVVGTYVADHRTEARREEYRGLGDDPVAIRVDHGPHGITLDDPGRDAVRPARDHRALVVERWRESEGDEVPLPAEAREAIAHAAKESQSSRAVRAAVLGTLFGVLLDAAPVPAAVLLFGQGLVRIHHAHRAHRLALRAEGDPAARAMLEEVRHRLDELSPEESRNLLELLTRELGR